MKLVMILTPADRLDDIQHLLDRTGVDAYTEIETLRGAGKSGRKMGTRAFPGMSGMLLTVLDDERVLRLTQAVRECCREKHMVEEVRMFSVPAEVLL